MAKKADEPYNEEQAMPDDNDKQWIDGKLENLLILVLNEIGRRAEEQTSRWESMDARLTLQAGLIQSGYESDHAAEQIR
jgi:hypothetical protein